MADTAVLMLHQEALTPTPPAAGAKASMSAKNPEKSAFSEVFNQHVRKAEQPVSRRERADQSAEASGKTLPKNGTAAAETGHSDARTNAARDKDPVKPTEPKTAKPVHDQDAGTEKTEPSSATPKPSSTNNTAAADEANPASVDGAADSDTETEHTTTIEPDLVSDLLLENAAATGTDTKPVLTASLAEQTAPETSLVNEVLQPAIAGNSASAPEIILPLNGLKMAMEALNGRAAMSAGQGEGLMRTTPLDDHTGLPRGQYLSTLLNDAMAHSDGNDAGADLAGRRQGQGAAVLSSLFMNRLSHDAFAGMPAAASDTAPLSGSEDGTDFTSVMNTLRPATTMAGASVPVIAVPTHAGHSAWAGAMGERVMWLAQNDMREAQLQLHPKHLGAVDVRISYQNDQVTVSFVTQNAAAKDALDAAMPRLRDMFSDQGLNLGDVNVAHDSNYGRERQQYGKNSGSASDDFIDGESLLLEGEGPLRQIGHGMLDLYA